MRNDIFALGHGHFLRWDFLKLNNNSRIFCQYLEIGGRLQPNFVNFQISIFSQNTNEFEKQVQALESVHPLISKYKQAGWKNSTAPRIFKLVIRIYQIIKDSWRKFERNEYLISVRKLVRDSSWFTKTLSSFFSAKIAHITKIVG